jgi:hypothetical protein
MKNVEYAFRDDVELYLTNIFNVLKYKELTQSSDYFGLFEPLEFFNLLWHIHHLIIHNKPRPLKVSKYLLSLKLKPAQLNYLCRSVRLSFNRIFNPLFKLSDDHELNICLEVIAGEFARAGHKVCGEKITVDFSVIKINAMHLSGYYEKIEYLTFVRAYFLETGDKASLILCDIELKQQKRLEKIRKLKFSPPAESSGTDAIYRVSSYPVSPNGLSPDRANVDRLSVSFTSSKNPEYIKKQITEKICSIDASKWKYIFLTDRDYDFFVDVLTNFFSNKKYSVDFDLILKKGCKTRLCPVLNAIYYNFSTLPLKDNSDFLNLMKKLSVFKNQSTHQIYLDIRRSKETF